MTVKDNHYLNNAEFKKELTAYIKAKKENPSLRVPDNIGRCIILISTNLAKWHKFCNYTYKEEMIGDGIENCIRYITNFNEEKSSNAFGYFSRICFQAFRRRIKKENKQTKIKRKIITNIDTLADSELASFHEDIDQRFFSELKSFAHSFNDNYENQKASKEYYDNSDLKEYM